MEVRDELGNELGVEVTDVTCVTVVTFRVTCRGDLHCHSGTKANLKVAELMMVTFDLIRYNQVYSSS